jgi:hypothetical protein
MDSKTNKSRNTVELNGKARADGCLEKVAPVLKPTLTVSITFGSKMSALGLEQTTDRQTAVSVLEY